MLPSARNLRNMPGGGGVWFLSNCFLVLVNLFFLSQFVLVAWCIPGTSVAGGSPIW